VTVSNVIVNIPANWWIRVTTSAETINASAVIIKNNL